MKYDHWVLYALIMILFIGGCGSEAEDENLQLYFPLPEEPGEVIRSDNLNFFVQTVVEGLDIPWGMTFLPDGVMLITERPGNIRMVVNGQIQQTPVDGGPDVFLGGTSGLMDIAAHPDFEENQQIFLTYAMPEENQAHTALMKAELNGAELTQQEVLFVGESMSESGAYQGSRIAFHDGYVFFSTGDQEVPVTNTAQDLSTHRGSILRLHEDGSFPLDNPFLGEEGAQPEIYSYGHRNPQGLAANPETGSLWSVEHGLDGGDEVNIIEKGGNYGWPVIHHGPSGRGSSSGEISSSNMNPPLYYWTEPVVPSGMAFVSGGRYPAWEGDLMISTLQGMRLVRLILDGDEIVGEEDLLEGLGRMRNVILGPDKLLYVALDSGEIIRLVPEDMVP